MYTVHLEALLEMAEILPHEVLLADGVLTLFDRSKGQAMFVSHQWTGVGHPDPTLQQLRVLQDALSNSLILFGLRSYPLAEALRSKPVFVWYDYFSCPQQRKKAPDPEGSLQHAIDSIPAYVSKCSLFVALCPAVESSDQSRIYNRSTWLDRGWCRLEWTMWNLSSVREPVIFVTGARHLEVSKTPQLHSVGEAAFSLEEDRHKVSKVLAVEFKKSLVKCLERGELAKYRFLLGWQKLGSGVLKLLISERADVDGRDSIGVTALLAAAYSKDATAVRILCQARADPNVKNDFTDTAWHTACEAGSLPELRAQSNGLTLNLERCLHTLSLGPGTAEAVHWLVDARADVNERMRPGTFFISFVFAAKSLEYRFKGSRSQFCSIAYHHSGATPLMFAILAGNFEVAAALSVRGADARIKNFRGKSAEDLAAEVSAPSYLVELLERFDVCRFTSESRIIGAKRTSTVSLRSEDYFEI
ncbi:unnamed protein product [Symbiodinium sp. CCMP2592]|nr:unnamed protein product [Symbiodinium sp. CCMP2592]